MAIHEGLTHINRYLFYSRAILQLQNCVSDFHLVLHVLCGIILIYFSRIQNIRVIFRVTNMELVQGDFKTKDDH